VVARADEGVERHLCLGEPLRPRLQRVQLPLRLAPVFSCPATGLTVEDGRRLAVGAGERDGAVGRADRLHAVPWLETDATHLAVGLHVSALQHGAALAQRARLAARRLVPNRVALAHQEAELHAKSVAAIAMHSSMKALYALTPSSSVLHGCRRGTARLYPGRRTISYRGLRSRMRSLKYRFQTSRVSGGLRRTPAPRPARAGGHGRSGVAAALRLSCDLGDRHADTLAVEQQRLGLRVAVLGRLVRGFLAGDDELRSRRSCGLALLDRRGQWIGDDRGEARLRIRSAAAPSPQRRAQRRWPDHAEAKAASSASRRARVSAAVSTGFAAPERGVTGSGRCAAASASLGPPALLVQPDERRRDELPTVLGPRLGTLGGFDGGDDGVRDGLAAFFCHFARHCALATFRVCVGHVDQKRSKPGDMAPPVLRGVGVLAPSSAPAPAPDKA
jgi:hypothetical protein